MELWCVLQIVSYKFSRYAKYCVATKRETHQFNLWNLVYVHKTCNSSKSNIIPNKTDIEKLKTRNKDLCDLLKDKDIKGKPVDELEIAINRDYVDKFWIGCKQ